MNEQKPNRRKFLKNSSIGLLGAGFIGKKDIAIPIQDQDDELPKIKEYRKLKPSAKFIGWIMWTLLLNDVYRYGYFSFKRSIKNFKQLMENKIITKEEFEKWAYFDCPIQITIPRRLEADRIIKKHLDIQRIFFGTEPEIGGVGPIYILKKRS